jgi:hypothetical protein
MEFNHKAHKEPEVIEHEGRKGKKNDEKAVHSPFFSCCLDESV